MTYNIFKNLRKENQLFLNITLKYFNLIDSIAGKIINADSIRMIYAYEWTLTTSKCCFPLHTNILCLGSHYQSLTSCWGM